MYGSEEDNGVFGIIQTKISSGWCVRIVVTVLVVSFLLMISFDMNISTHFQDMKSEGSCTYIFSHAITDIGSSKLWLIGSALAFIFFWLSDDSTNRLKSALFFLSISISGILVNILKVIFARARPESFFERGQEGFYFFESGYALASFPSGHSATAMGIGVMLALYFPKYKWLFLLFFAGIAFTRVIVTAHFLSDVLVGSLIGGLVSYYLYTTFIQKRTV